MYPLVCIHCSSLPAIHESYSGRTVFCVSFHFGHGQYTLSIHPHKTSTVPHNIPTQRLPTFITRLKSVKQECPLWNAACYFSPMYACSPVCLFFSWDTSHRFFPTWVFKKCRFTNIFLTKSSSKQYISTRSINK